MAVMIHCVIILGITFADTPATSTASTLEITLAMHDSSSQPEDADYIAQHNQQGSGTTDEKAELTTRQEALYNDLQIKETGMQRQQKQEPKPSNTSQLASEVVTSAASNVFNVSLQEQPLPQQAQSETLDRDQQLSQDIASLRARLDQRQQAYAKRPRIHRITSVSTKSSDDALYQYQFQQKVEQIGNENYPVQARRQNIEGDVQLVVVLKPNGTIQEIVVEKSSGQPILDAAAIRSVRASAPFPPFPRKMREKADLLEIIRTWRFSKNQLSSHG